MKNSAALFCAVCIIALHGIAADKYYLVKEEMDATYKTYTEYGFYDPGKWTKGGILSGVYSNTFDPEADYIVKNTHRRLAIKGDASATFQGGRIVLGEGKDHGALLVYMAKPNVIGFGNHGLCLRRGCILLAGVSKEYQTDGAIEVDTNTSSGSYTDISFNGQNMVLTHQGTLSVVEGKLLSVGAKNAFGGGKYRGTFELTKENSCQDVKGTVAVVSAFADDGSVIADYDTTFSVATTSLPGTLSIGRCCRLRTYSGNDRLTVETLVFEDDSLIDMAYDAQTGNWGLIEVSGTLSVDGTVRISLPGSFECDGKVAVLKAPASSGITAGNFRMASVASHMDITVEEEDGRLVVYIQRSPTVYAKAETFDLDKAGAGVWSDGLDTHQGTNYVLDCGLAGTSKITAEMPDSVSGYDFPGDSLTLGDKCTLHFVYNDTSAVVPFTCKWLRLCGGSIVSASQKGAVKLKGGRITAIDGTVKFAAGNGRGFVVESDIDGSAELLLMGYNGASGMPYASYSFTGDNSGFMGKITVRQERIDEYTDAEGTHPRNDYGTKYNILTVSDAKALGGALRSLSPKALTLSRYGQFRATGDITLAAESNRGIFIENIGRIFVDQAKGKAHRLRIETSLAIHGTCYKEGSGVLELAGQMAFGSNADNVLKAPAAGYNNFVVTGGVVRACSAGAIDGCAMLFHEGTSLELAMDPENGELAGRGFINVRTDAPFALGDGVGKLPLSLKFPEGMAPPSARFTVPFLTVSAAAANSVRAMLPAVRLPFRSYRATLVETVEKDDKNNPKYVTFAYELRYQAMKVIVR